MRVLALATGLTASASSVLAATYGLTSNVVGNGFNSFFSYQAIADPTNGRVNYVNQATAQADNLTYASSDTFILRADATTTLSPSGPGRNSVRLASNSQYSTHVAIFNIRHMPQGCGTWPAIWELGADWPNQGETDILEGVNDVSPNQATLHTSAGCSIPSTQSEETGTIMATDCEGNSGCGVQSNSPFSYGPTFNGHGGGWYAMERTDTYIKVWFWSRTDNTVPSQVANGAGSIDTSTWGTPFAFFSDTDCDITSHFGPHQIIINLTFCGDWAGAVYASDGCPGDCVDYVNQNPLYYQNAYFDFAWMNIYQ